MKEKQKADEAHAAKKTLAHARRQLKDTNDRTRKRKAELLDAERVIEAQHSIRNFSLDSLGQGKARSGGPAARKIRLQVLDRFARLGTGLSPPQRNDWAWFKEAWDDKMSQEHKDDWGGLFASWMQKVMEDLEAGILNAFSVFVHNETRRCLSDVPLLSVPG